MKDAIIMQFLAHAIANARGQEWEGHSVTAILEAIQARMLGAVPQYKVFVEVYFEFFEAQVGMKPKMTAGGGAALKRVANYLKSVSHEQTEQGALDGWRFILGNWKKLSPFLQQQTGLQQIEKNINEIVTQLKRGHADKAGNTAANKQQLSDLDKSLSEFIARRASEVGDTC